MTGAVESAYSIGSPGADSSTSNNDTFVSYYTVDNLGEVTETRTFNAEGYTPTAAMSARWRGWCSTAQSTAGYDDLGRVYNSSIFSVVNGSAGTVLTSNAYYDADGNVIAVIGPTGAATKYAYDGADRETFVYITDGGQINNFSNVTIGTSAAYIAAGSVTGDVVVTQTQDLYDADGNVKETITSDRFGTDANTSTARWGRQRPAWTLG